ncbi:MAG: hypothetical protein KC589_05485 [Nanoarchaeota archaeon]|nr:hypothetical protein [Nanoarchaeota archaeon]
MTNKEKPKIKFIKPEIDLPSKFKRDTIMLITPQNENKQYLCAYNNQTHTLHYLLENGPQYTPIKIPNGQVLSINKNNLEKILKKIGKSTTTTINPITYFDSLAIGNDPDIGSCELQ